MKSYALPKFLQYDKLKNLNDAILSRTGCFAFLKTEQVSFVDNSNSPKSARDAFMAFSVGLYILYYDYGKALCKILLDYSDKIHVGIEKTELSSKRTHVNDLTKIFRHNTTHGSFFSEKRLNFIETIYASRYLDLINNHSIDSDWTQFIRDLSDIQWEKIVNKLTKDADGLYDFLNDWSLKVEKANKRFDVRKRFCEKMAEEGSKILDIGFLHNYAEVINIKNKVKRFSEDELKNIFDTCLKDVVQMFADDKCKTPGGICKNLKKKLKDIIDPPEGTNLPEKHGLGL